MSSFWFPPRSKIEGSAWLNQNNSGNEPFLNRDSMEHGTGLNRSLWIAQPGKMVVVVVVGSVRWKVLSRAANRSIGEVVQSRRRPLLGPSPG